VTNIRLTKQFAFEMAHSLWKYDGLCKNIHGHSYKLDVTIIGVPISDESDKKLGMVMDFTDLKEIVNRTIIKKLDHAYMINEKSDHKKLHELNEMFERHDIVNYQPTCEMMIIDFAKRIKKELPPHIQLHSLKLRETANSYAEWYAEDNTND